MVAVSLPFKAGIFISLMVVKHAFITCLTLKVSMLPIIWCVGTCKKIRTLHVWLVLQKCHIFLSKFRCCLVTAFWPILSVTNFLCLHLHLRESSSATWLMCYSFSLFFFQFERFFKHFQSFHLPRNGSSGVHMHEKSMKKKEQNHIYMPSTQSYANISRNICDFIYGFWCYDWTKITIQLHGLWFWV